MNKKASLSLSITAIVVIVIAFVVLGLGLGLTQKIFQQGESELIKAFDITELKAEPTSSNPITVPGTVSIDAGKQKTMDIGFYNVGPDTATDAKFKVRSCVSRGEPMDPDDIPDIDSIPTTVSASTGKGFSVILYEQGLKAGETYICTMAVCRNDDCEGEDNLYEDAQFFLKVVA